MWKKVWRSLTVEIEFYLGSFNNIFQVSFNKMLSQQLTHDRSYMLGDLLGMAF